MIKLLIEKIEQMNESDTFKVDTSRWENEYGKKPKGSGGWAFEVNGKTYISKNMKYADAVIWVRKQAKDDGVYHKTFNIVKLLP